MSREEEEEERMNLAWSQQLQPSEKNGQRYNTIVRSVVVEKHLRSHQIFFTRKKKKLVSVRCVCQKESTCVLPETRFSYLVALCKVHAIPHGQSYNWIALQRRKQKKKNLLTVPGRSLCIVADVMTTFLDE